MSKTPIELQRESLQEILESIEGVSKVYYQPPYNVTMKYPCIVYMLNKFESKYASDRRYLSFPSYTLTLIDYDPESAIQEQILNLNTPCNVSFDRLFTSDNLYHFVYTLVYTQLLW